MMRVGVLDDWQEVARASADWSAVEARAEVTMFSGAFADEDEAAAALADYEILLLMRERTPFPATLIERLPKLRMIALTGARSPSLDTAACAARGIVISTTGGMLSSATTAELTLGLLIAGTRRIAQGDAAIRAGRFQEGVAVGPALAGKVLGIVGLGKIGGRMARFGAALEMDVVAWSRSLDEAGAAAAGARLASGLVPLLREADVVTLHVPLSAASHGLMGAAEIAEMKPGALLVNTSRAGLVDTAAMLAALHDGRIGAALDVFDTEPLPIDDPIRTAPNTVLTPHLGYGTTEGFEVFYRESVENILAFLDGRPQRLMK